jgi:hypothetical protein
LADWIADRLAPEIAVEDEASNDLEDGVSVISFGNVEVGGSSQHILTIHNVETEVLSGLEANIGGVHASDFSAPALARSRLIPGASTTLSVSFAPSSTGLRSASVAITSNALTLAMRGCVAAFLPQRSRFCGRTLLVDQHGAGELTQSRVGLVTGFFDTETLQNPQYHFELAFRRRVHAERLYRSGSPRRVGY